MSSRHDHCVGRADNTKRAPGPLRGTLLRWAEPLCVIQRIAADLVALARPSPKAELTLKKLPFRLRSCYWSSDEAIVAGKEKWAVFMKRNQRDQLSAASRLHAKKALAAEPPVALPVYYGRTRLILMEIDPFHIHAFWEVTPHDHKAALRKLKAGNAAPAWVLRFHDIRAGNSFDVPIELAAGNWYVDLWAADKTYETELGPLAANGRFVPVCRSNIARTPAVAPVPHDDPTWLQVKGVFEKVEQVHTPELPGSLAPANAPAPVVLPEQHFPIVAPPFVANTSTNEPGAQASEPGEQPVVAAPRAVNVELPPPAAPGGALPQPVSSFSPEGVSSFDLGGGGSGAGQSEPSINLELNAEVVVYGRAQPGQTLRVNGRWVPVNSDGTFHVRWALPTATP